MSAPHRARLAATGLLVAAAAAALATAPLAAGAPLPAGAPALFVASGDRGTLRPVKGTAGRFVLDLAGAGAVTSFTDRPARAAGSESIAGFVTRWRARGFAADPPNAALEVPGAPAGRDVVILELTRPRLLGPGTVRFQARRVGSASPALARLVRRGDARTAREFGRWNLFVDPSAAAPVAIGLDVEMPAGAVSLAFDAAQVTEDSVRFSGLLGTFTGTVLATDRALQVTAQNPTGFTASLLLSGTSGATLTGTAVVPAGASVTATGPAGPVQITNGTFAIPLS
jgi:hypothetical protein